MSLRFPLILELIDFEMVALEVSCYEVDRTALTITARFSENEISLAPSNHQAAVLETASA
ncbi:MAG: hypothetical protein JWP27_2417 [Flaviaesturariibacter sp.]|nr:hypothetical protein [Flaviaesturariibacter sp.]